jgi:hypothetical protein
MLQTKQHFSDLRLRMAYCDDMTFCFFGSQCQQPGRRFDCNGRVVSVLRIRNVPGLNPDSFLNPSWEIMG